MLEDRLIDIMKSRDELLEDLELVRGLNLPNWWIAAGYVRNYIWDYLHNYSVETKLNDVDIIYYDPFNISENREKELESQLIELKPRYNWSIKNQARMHLRAGDLPYQSVQDAMKRWPETATAVGITLDEHNQLQVIAPHGLEDLFQLVVRRSHYFQDEAYYYQRINQKQWMEHWRELTMM